MMADSISNTAIRIAEIKYIRPAFGDMYTLLYDKYADFANEFVKPALAYFVKCEIISSTAIDMSNSGVAISNPQYQSAASDKQRQRLYDSEMSKAKTLLDFALSYVAIHSDEFPDFSGDAPLKHHRIGGLLLNDRLSKSIKGEAFKVEYEKYLSDMQAINDLVIIATKESAEATSAAKDATQKSVIATEAATKATTAANEAGTEAVRIATESANKATTATENAEQATEAATQATTAANDAAQRANEEVENLRDKADTDGYYPDMTVGKAEKLSFTVKDNGNIVIDNPDGQTKEFMAATPSGDPQHYLYEAVGAVYNASTGYWSIYDMTDVTNEEMRAACARGVWNPSETTPFRQDSPYFTYRFSLFRTGPYNATPTGGLAYWAYYNKDIEVINIGSNPKMGGTQNMICGNSMLSAFSGCSKLRAIINGQLQMANSPTTIVMTNAFAGCSALEDIKISGLKASISFADSPNLSYDSVLYMLENSDTSVSGTIITLNPDAYDRIMAEDASGDSDIGNYLTNYSHIELARG